MATFRSRSRSGASSQRAASTRRPGSPLPHPAPPPLFAAIEDLNRGTVPSNEQLKAWLAYLSRSFAVSTGQLSESGKGLVRDIQELVGLLQTVVEEKNEDGLLQRFVTHARLAGKLAVQGMQRTGRVQIVKEPRRQVYLFGSRDIEVRERSRELRKEALKEVRALYRLLQLIVASPEVRQSVQQVQEISRILFRPSGAGRPPQGKKYRAQPAKTSKSVSFKEEPSRMSSGMSASDLDRGIEALRGEVRVTEAGMQEIRSMAGIAVSERTTKTGEYVYRSEGKQPSMPSPLSQEKPRGAGDESEIRYLSTDLPEINPDQAERLPIFQEGKAEEHREEHKEEQYKEQYEHPEVVKEKEYVFTEKQPVQTDRGEVIERLRTLLRGISANKELKKSLTEASTYISTLQALGQQTVRDPASPIPADLQYEENIKAAQRDLLLIFQRFSGNNSLEEMVAVVTEVRQRMGKDYELKDFMGDWGAFLRRCLSKDGAGYLESAEFEDRAGFLLDRTGTVGEKYGDQFGRAQACIQQFLEGWKSDDLTAKIGRVLQRIVRQDILGSQQSQQGGQTTANLFLTALMKPDLIQDFRTVILPSMLANLHEIPVPRIESVSDGTRLVLEGIVLPAGGFMPAELDVRQASSIRMNPRERLRSSRTTETLARKRTGWHNTVRIRMSGMQANLRNVRFEVDKTAGWPKLHDDGLADLRFAGKGMSIVMNLAAASTPTKQPSSIFSRTSTKKARAYLEPTFVRVKIDRLALDMHDTRRDWMYKLARPFIAARVKRTIERSVRDQIVSSITALDNISRRLASGYSY